MNVFKQINECFKHETNLDKSIAFKQKLIIVNNIFVFLDMF